MKFLINIGVAAYKEDAKGNSLVVGTDRTVLDIKRECDEKLIDKEISAMISQINKAVSVVCIEEEE